MEYKVINGDLLNADADVIIHQVNCQGAMNSGVARGIRNKYPEVYTEYLKYCNSARLENRSMLGDIQFIQLEKMVDTLNKHNKPKFCCNMYTQDKFGYDGKQYTSIEAMKKALEEINVRCRGMNVAFPWKVGCVRGGADWSTVLRLITETLTKVNSLTFYKLDI